MIAVPSTIVARTKQQAAKSHYNRAYWSKFGGQPALDLPLLGPGPGGTAKDYSPNGNNGTLTGGVTWQRTPYGISLQTDGSTGYINLGKPTALQVQPTSPFSLGGWLTPISNAGFGRFYGGDQGGNLNGLRLYVNSSSGTGPWVLEIDNSVGTVFSVSSPSNIVFGKRQHVFGTSDGANLRLYINGLLVASASPALTGVISYSSVTGFGIGARPTGAANFLKANTEQFQFFITCLSAAQVAAIYARTWARFSRRQSDAKIVIAGGAFNQSLAGVLSSSGLLGRGVGVQPSSVLSFSGLTGRGISTKQGSSLTFTGAVNKGSNVKELASLSFAGSANRGTTTKQAATLSFTGNQKYAVGKVLAATLTFLGAIGRATNNHLSGVLSFTGSIRRDITNKLFATLSFAGALSNGHAVSKALSAALSFSGNVGRGVGKSVSGSLGFVGAINRGIGKTLTAGLSFAGVVGRGISKGLSATLGFLAVLGNGTKQRLLMIRRWFLNQ